MINMQDYKKYIYIELQMEEICFETKLTLFFCRCFRIMSARIASCDNYLTHDKWRNAKNQNPSHSFVYRCVTKLNQKRCLVLLVLFHKVSQQTDF